MHNHIPHWMPSFFLVFLCLFNFLHERIRTSSLGTGYNITFLVISFPLVPYVCFYFLHERIRTSSLGILSTLHFLVILEWAAGELVSAIDVEISVNQLLRDSPGLSM